MMRLRKKVALKLCAVSDEEKTNRRRSVPIEALVEKAYSGRRGVLVVYGLCMFGQPLNKVGFRLYERFRPEVAEGVVGWGKKALLDIGRIRKAGG